MLTEAKYRQKYGNTFKSIAKSMAILLLKKNHFWYRNTFINKVLILVLQYIYKVLLTSLLIPINHSILSKFIS